MYDWYTHPQRLAGRRRAIVGKGVECDVQPAIGSKVPGIVRHETVQVESFPGNTRVGKQSVIPFPGGLISKGRILDYEAAVRDRSKQFCPYLDDPRIDLGKIVEGTEGNLSTLLAGRLGNGRCAGRGLIAQEAGW